jgi:hypothetical protein
MEVDEVLTCSLDMRLVWEFYVLLFECYTELLVHLGTNGMFIKSTEYLTIFPLEDERYTLSVEIFLYLECLLETYACLVLRAFFIGFDFF